MEVINESSKLIAQSVEILKEMNDMNLDEAIKLLELALEKLSKSI